jgi:hypothetical protein
MLYKNIMILQIKTAEPHYLAPLKDVNILKLILNKILSHP